MVGRRCRTRTKESSELLLLVKMSSLLVLVGGFGACGCERVGRRLSCSRSGGLRRRKCDGQE